MTTRPQRRVVEPLKAKNARQQKYIDAIKSGTLTFGLGPAGTGKAQPLDAKVLTPHGWATMGNMTTGSFVIGSDGKPKQVSGVYPQGERQVFRVSFTDGRSTECCAEHLWEVSYFEWASPRVVNTTELLRLSSQKSKRSRIRVRLVEPVEFEEKNYVIHPYVMGVILGDGSITQRNTVGISSGDYELIDRVDGLLPDECQIVHRSKYDFSVTTFQGKGGVNPVSRDLATRGLFGADSFSKEIPADYLLGSVEQRWELLRGLMDSDGTIDKSGHISFSTSSASLRDGVLELVRGLGGICSVSEKIPTYSHGGVKKQGALNYVLHIRLKSPKMAFALSRKKDRAPESNQYSAGLSLGVVSVTAARVTEAQCIMVESDDHLYVTDSFVLTHNTYIAGCLAAQALLNGDAEKIVVTRPAVDAGESLGFLPGELEDKYAPYIAAFQDVLNERLGKSHVEYLIKTGRIEAQPLAYMRGLTFKNAFVIMDEAQNATPAQMKLFLTRIGENAKVVVNGDLAQKDIPGISGLEEAVRRVSFIPEVRVVTFDSRDIVRSGLCQEIVSAWDNYTPALTPPK